MNALEVDMSVTEARQVTQRINLLLGNIADTTSKVLDLIEKAEAGAAWRSLSYPSWTAYVSVEFSRALEGLARAERIPITAKLSETGMSTRAIGSVVGVSKSQVANDVRDSQVSRTGHLQTTGTDGKTYTRPATFLPSGKPDAKSTEDMGRAVPPVQPKPRKRPLPDSYREMSWKVLKSVESVSRLHQDDRFTRNREAVAHCAPELARAANELLDLLDDLGVDRHQYGGLR